MMLRDGGCQHNKDYRPLSLKGQNIKGGKTFRPEEYQTGRGVYFMDKPERSASVEVLPSNQAPKVTCLQKSERNKKRRIRTRG